MKRFENAQIGDLLWSDDLGICKVENIENPLECLFPIKISSENGGEKITLDGKRYVNSPKATFFYYTTENHYLTERPDPEKEKNWKEWEDKEILVRNNEISKWRKRKLYRYQPEFKRKFACYPSNCFKEEPLSFEQAKLIE
jgi:hypothetical protein